MIMLHIKLDAITKCSNMLANLLPANPHLPLTLGFGFSSSKVNFFRTWSCCISN